MAAIKEQALVQAFQSAMETMVLWAPMKLKSVKGQLNEAGSLHSAHTLAFQPPMATMVLWAPMLLLRWTLAKGLLSAAGSSQSSFATHEMTWES